MKVAAVLVHYHVAPLLVEAAAALRADLAAAGHDAELVIVDNGSTAAERRLLEEVDGRLLANPGNPGYAAALNLGVRETTAEEILLMNPDVFVRPGCVAELLAALDTAAVAGPLFYWDRGGRLVLPPAERRRLADEILARLARRSARWARQARRRWRRHARRHWEAARPLRSAALSGALLATRRSVLSRVGPFDEGYRLYFEETDWLRRLERAGLRALFVPAARAVHLYGQSAGAEPRAGEWFAASARRFAELHYGRHGARLLAWLDRMQRAPASPRTPLPTGAERVAAADAGLPVLELDALRPESSMRGPVWLELSPRPQGFPAAAERLASGRSRPWSPPREVWDRLPAGDTYVRVVSSSGVEGPLLRLRKDG